MASRVRVRYFAQLRDALGASEEVDLDLPAREGEVLARLAALHPRQKDILMASRVAVGDGYVDAMAAVDAAALEAGMDIISPISGG